jgi:hypothetical protein
MILCESYSESNLCWAVNKQWENKNYIQKIRTYALLLNVVTAKIEALVLSGNKFLYACVRENAARELGHILTPSINSSLLLQRNDFNQFFE